MFIFLLICVPQSKTLSSFLFSHLKAEFSDSEINAVDDIYRSYRFEMLEEEKEDGTAVSPSGKRSMSLAEIGKDGKGTASLDGK